MKPNAFGLLFALLAALASPAAAQGGGGGPGGGGGGGGNSKGSTTLGQAGTDPIGVSLFPVASMHDMAGKKWTFAVAPGIWDIKKIVILNGQTPNEALCPAGGCSKSTTFPSGLHGWVLGAALKREVSAHWGYGVLVGIARQTKPMELKSYQSSLMPPEASSGTAGGAGAPGGEFSEVNGNSIAFLVTYDPFTDPDRFRMPVSIGPFFASQGFKFKNAFTNPNNGRAQEESVDFKRSFGGIMANISFDFIFFKSLRVSPGFIIGMGSGTRSPSYDYVVKQDVSGTKAYRTKLRDTRPEVGALYIELLYRPWGLSLSKPFIPEGGYLEATTVKWTHKWGG